MTRNRTGNRFRAGFLALAAVLALASAAPARADRERGQDYAFLSDVDGEVRIAAAAYGGDVLRARRNQPLTPGDRIDTGRRGRVEAVLPGGALLFVDARTRVSLVSLADTLGWDRDETLLDLPNGRIGVRIPNGGAEARVDLYDATVYLQPGGFYFVGSEDRDRLLVSTVDGVAEVVTDFGSEVVYEGESLTGEDGDWNVGRRRRIGRFDEWAVERASWRDSRRGRYVPERIGWASSILEQHGTWSYVDDLGGHGWYPRVSSGWRPYTLGSWYTTPAGLTWMSDEPWGWAPYHYGSWTMDRRGRWVWLPDEVYSPAWVYWYSDPEYVGWAPVGYWDAWYDRDDRRSGASFSFGFRTSWSGSSISLSGSDLRPWNILPMPDFSRLLPGTSISASLVPSARMQQSFGRRGSSGTIIAQPLVVAPSRVRSHGDLMKAAGLPPMPDRDRRGVDLTQAFGRPSEAPKAPAQLREMFRSSRPERRVENLVERTRADIASAPGAPAPRIAAPQPEVQKNAVREGWRGQNRTGSPGIRRSAPGRIEPREPGGPATPRPGAVTPSQPGDAPQAAPQPDRRPFGGNVPRRRLDPNQPGGAPVPRPVRPPKDDGDAAPPAEARPTWAPNRKIDNAPPAEPRPGIERFDRKREPTPQPAPAPAPAPQANPAPTNPPPPPLAPAPRRFQRGAPPTAAPAPAPAPQAAPAPGTAPAPDAPGRSTDRFRRGERTPRRALTDLNGDGKIDGEDAKIAREQEKAAKEKGKNK